MNVKFTPSRRQMLVGIASLTGAAVPFSARAEAWKPTKNVRIVVPFAAGGISDVMGRKLGSYLEGRWGQSVIIDNSPAPPASSARWTS